MKHILGFVISVILLAIVAAAYMYSQNARLWWRHGSIGFCLTKNEFRAWSIRYHSGPKLEADGKVRNKWHLPKVYHMPPPESAKGTQ